MAPARPSTRAADGYVRSRGLRDPGAEAAVADAFSGRRSDSGADSRDRGQSGRRKQRPDRAQPAAQEAVIRAALVAAAWRPTEVSYVEAHGTGTSLGDPIECRLSRPSTAAGGRAIQPLVVASVKTNIGHLESAPGVAGLIKVILSFEHQEIPAHLHYRARNPAFRLGDDADRRSAAVDALWPRRAGLAAPASARLASAASTATSSSKRHRHTPAIATTTSEASALVLPLSARDPAALMELAQSAFRIGSPPWTRRQGCGTSATRLRCAAATTIIASRFPAARLASSPTGSRRTGTGRNRKGWRAARCRSNANGSSSCFPVKAGNGPGCPEHCSTNRPFSPPSWKWMPPCDRTWAGRSSRRFATPIRRGWRTPMPCNRCFLPTRWRWRRCGVTSGITPDAVIGHSFGEVAAATVAGALDLESGGGPDLPSQPPPGAGEWIWRDGARRVAMGPGSRRHRRPRRAFRGRLQRSTHHRALGRSRGDRSPHHRAGRTRRLLPSRQGRRRRAQRADGPARRSARRGNRRTAATREHRAVSFHGDRRRARRQAPRRGLLGEEHARSGSVLARIARVDRSGPTMFLELGPHPVLCPAIESALHHLHRQGSAVPSAERDDEALALRTAIGRLYVSGAPVRGNGSHRQAISCRRFPIHGNDAARGGQEPGRRGRQPSLPRRASAFQRLSSASPTSHTSRANISGRLRATRFAWSLRSRRGSRGRGSKRWRSRPPQTAWGPRRTGSRT